MPKRARELKALDVSRLQEVGLYAVGVVPGLHLQITSATAKSWLLRIKVGTKRREIGLGPYPAVTLAMAHEKAREARTLVERGIDPVVARAEAKSTLIADQARAKTFEECTRAYIESHRSGWKGSKNANQWTSSMENYAFPVLGGMLVRDVTLTEVLKVLEPIWHTKTTTADRVRNRIEKVLDWAKGRGYRTGDNPAAWKGSLDAQFPPAAKVSRPKHHKALPLKDAAAFMAELKQHKGMGARALEFVIYTATRSAETRKATWGEFDLEKGVWQIPGSRMKGGWEHRVPLSKPALELLRSLPRFEGEDLVFPGNKEGRPVSDMTMTALMRRLGVDAVPHGFRSTFRDWAAEFTTAPKEICEMCLAHRVAGSTEAAYWRSDNFAKRRVLMTGWADFLASPELATAAAEVVPIRHVRDRA